MQFVLIPFALCFLLYIRQENQYRFRAATALKITLTMTLTLCLTVALARRFSPVLLTAAANAAALVPDTDRDSGQSVPTVLMEPQSEDERPEVVLDGSGTV